MQTFADWIKNASVGFGSIAAHHEIHNKLKTNRENIPITAPTWAILCRMHEMGRIRDDVPRTGPKDDCLEWFVTAISAPRGELEVAFELLHRRYLIERDKSPDEIARMLPRRLTPEEEDRATAVAFFGGVLLLGLLCGGFGLFTAMLGTWGVGLLLAIFGKISRNNSIEPIDGPGRGSDLSGGG